MNLPLDENSREGIGGALNTNPNVIQDILVDPTKHGIKVVDGTGQANNGNHQNNAVIDENGRSCWYGLSSTGSGQRIIVYVNISGALLTQHT